MNRAPHGDTTTKILRVRAAIEIERAQSEIRAALDMSARQYLTYAQALAIVTGHDTLSAMVYRDNLRPVQTRNAHAGAWLSMTAPYADPVATEIDCGYCLDAPACVPQGSMRVYSDDNAHAYVGFTQREKA